MIIPRGNSYRYTLTDRSCPGPFKYSLHSLVDNEIDLSVFDTRYRNDEMGAPAYDPAILLKIILYAYSRGITSSRKITQCCQERIDAARCGGEMPLPGRRSCDGSKILRDSFSATASNSSYLKKYLQLTVRSSMIGYE